MGERPAGTEDGDDTALLERARGGDGEALAQLLERHQGQVYRFSMRMCRNPEDASDVLQETLLSAVRNLASFRGDAKLSTWLFSIARSFCIKQRLKTARARAAADDDALQTPVAGALPEDTVADRELLGALDSALHVLDADSRAVLLLRDVEGLSAKETAASLDMSVPQVKSRLHRARAQLREHIREPLSAVAPIDGACQPGCPDIVDMFSKYLEDEIGPAMCDQMQDHIETCGFCRSTCDSLKRTVAVCNAVPTPSVPREVQVRLRHEIRRHLEG